MYYFVELILKLAKVDRRWIFLIIGFVVLIPLIYPLALPIRPGKDSKEVYDFVEGLDDSSKVLLSCEYGPSTKPEIHPMVTSLLHHLFSLDRGHKVYVVCLWPDGQFMAEEALEEVAEKRFGLTYGEDYVMLGFRPGNEAVVKGIVSDLRKLNTIDAKDGGSTDFFDGTSLQPELGSLVFFPATWTYVHRGRMTKVNKYICNGWINHTPNND